MGSIFPLQRTNKIVILTSFRFAALMMATQLAYKMGSHRSCDLDYLEKLASHMSCDYLYIWSWVQGHISSNFLQRYDYPDPHTRYHALTYLSGFWYDSWQESTVSMTWYDTMQLSHGTLSVATVMSANVVIIDDINKYYWLIACSSIDFVKLFQSQIVCLFLFEFGLPVISRYSIS